MRIEEISPEYAVRRLTAEDADAVYELSAGNPLFYRYCPPFVTRESILQDMQALPPNMTPEDKYYIGYFLQERLVAIMDLILRYPREDTAFIGLFMADASVQGKGVGSRIIRQACDYLRGRGFVRIRLGYAAGNLQSRGFWRKNGFVETGEEHDAGEYRAVVMQKELC